eukprot:2474401-Pleurochrysis_carterae.AAC.1
MLRHILRALLADTAYQSVASFAEVAHISGDANAAADAVSRGHWTRFRDLCAQLHVRPQEVPTP